MTGLMIEIGAFAVGVYTAVIIGDVNPASIANTATAGGSDTADIGVVRAFSAWLPGLRLVGIAVLLLGVVFVLTTIRKILRFQSDRITELAS